MAECNHCGGFVTDDYVRVFGDNENRIEDCRNCPTVRATDDGEGDDGREVLLREVRETAGRERDDAADHPGADPGDDRETAVGADETERHEADVRVEASGTAESVGDIGVNGSGPDDGETDTSAADAVPEGEDDEDDGTGSRIQSGLSAMVSALRS